MTQDNFAVQIRFRRVAPGHYLDDVTGVAIVRIDGRQTRWQVRRPSLNKIGYVVTWDGVAMRNGIARARDVEVPYMLGCIRLAWRASVAPDARHGISGPRCTGLQDDGRGPCEGPGGHVEDCPRHAYVMAYLDHPSGSLRTCADPGDQEHDHAMCEDVVAEEKEALER